MGEKVNAFYGLTGDGKTAVIEMAAASGLMLVAPEKRNPLLASSFGTGELIRHALDNGIRHIILGIGGSATVSYTHLVEVILERVTNISMGSELDNVMEFEDIADNAADAPTETCFMHYE